MFIKNINANIICDKYSSFWDILLDYPEVKSKAIAIKINNSIVADIHTSIDKFTSNEIEFLLKDDSNSESLEILRHSCAHLFAHAMTELYPNVQVSIGPVIENGWYYDFDLDVRISETDFPKIEDKMKEISKRSLKVMRIEESFESAKQRYNTSNHLYKQKILNEKILSGIISSYQQGDFIDMCRGPHVPSTSYIQHFRLTKVSGAYWNGDSKNTMLQRVYGTAFFSKDSLNNHLHLLQEAEKRDHRKLGKELDLFHQQEEAVGDVFWHHNGVVLYNIIENYIRKKILANGYIEVKTPQIVSKKLWERSGHWEKFRENMITTTVDKDSTECAIKPMNCPCHIEIFNQGLKSYRDLPIRMSEFGRCNRYEPSGALHGLFRLRSFVQDDAHIFCIETQIESEAKQFIQLLSEVYRDFGFDNFSVKLSTRPEKRAGSDEVWDLAEEKMESVLKQMNISYTLNAGEGAFYGPKYEFVLKDAIGRDWQCGTLQLDFVLPERLNATYINETGEKQYCIIMHRAILGSIERFIGMLIENFEGKFPLWLSPVQVSVIGVSNKFDEHVMKNVGILKQHNIRTEHDLSNETVSYKIRKAFMKKIPYTLVIGQNELDTGLFSIRNNLHNIEKKMPLEHIINLLSNNEEL